MSRTAVGVLITVAATVAALWLVAGGHHYPHEGPFVSITRTHGIHAGDVVIAFLWFVLMWFTWRWVRRRPRPSR